MLAGMNDGIMIRRIRLDQHLAWQRMPSCASGYLRQQLECLLRRPEIGQVERRISGDDANQCHIREIQSLRDHLCAEQHIGFFIPELA
ncbi:hypothetical protein D3C73_1125260 [compost metagenome]